MTQAHVRDLGGRREDRGFFFFYPNNKIAFSEKLVAGWLFIRQIYSRR